MKNSFSKKGIFRINLQKDNEKLNKLNTFVEKINKPFQEAIISCSIRKNVLFESTIKKELNSTDNEYLSVSNKDF